MPQFGKFIQLAQQIPSALPHLVFVGGVTLPLYFTEPSAYTVRPSHELDAIVNLPSRLDFLQLEARMTEQGARHVSPPDALPSRWEVGSIRLNLIPFYTESMGFLNRWHEEGAFHAQSLPIMDIHRIKIFTPAYYLAAKIDAFRQRGEQHFRYSKDFEDIVALLDHRPEIVEEVQSAFYEVRAYIQGHITGWLSDPYMIEGVYAALPLEVGQRGVEKVLHRMEAMRQTSASLV